MQYFCNVVSKMVQLLTYTTLTFLLVGPFFEEGGRGLENFGQKLKILGFFSIEVAPNDSELKFLDV